jgi:hypothetical protein
MMASKEKTSKHIVDKQSEFWEIKIEAALARLENERNKPTLRDQFAMAAVSGSDKGCPRDRAIRAYHVANFMIAEREKNEDK